MAAQKREINLLPQEGWERKPIARVVRWVLTIGRYIVITTELIVIIAFISRFKLDRDLSDLYEEIEIKQARVKSSEKFEEEFRLTQNRLKVLKEIEKGKNSFSQIILELTSSIPLNITLNSLEIDKDKLSIDGFSLSESSLAVLINNLKKSDFFGEIEVTRISKGSSLTIDFELTVSLNPIKA
ncbi:MAG: PilN domain-containing protein [Candidatus Pacebacteria bacterium]|nr:PilN domain-containing protein [Candidatus Paceibacterota bacterium]